MTLVEEIKQALEVRRDANADKYGVHIVENMHSLGTYKQADFKAGADSMVPIILRLVPALQYYDSYEKAAGLRDNVASEAISDLCASLGVGEKK